MIPITPMKRFLLTLATIAAFLAPAANAKQTALSDVKPVKVTDSIYTFDGPIANCVALTGPDGVLLVDTPETTDLAKAVDAAIGTLNAKPVKYLVNTHKHFDHVNGNALYGERGATIIAHESVRKAILTEVPYFAKTRLPAAAAPTLCFEKDLTLHFDGEEIYLYHPETNGAHTSGDVVVYFRKANVLAAGDLFCNGMFMSLEISDKGWLRGEVEALKAILPLVDDKTIVIPGHGDISDKRGLERMLTVYDDINAKLEAMIAAGKTLDEIKAAHITAPYDAELGKVDLHVNGMSIKGTPDRFVETAYKAAMAHKNQGK